MKISVYGFWLSGAGVLDSKPCDGSTIANNTIEGNGLYGLQILNSFGNRVFDVFIGNNGTTYEYEPAKVQAFDDGTSFWNATGYGNLWGDWTTPDSNGDGIVDEGYLIDGGANKDLLPLAVGMSILSPADGVVTGDANVGISGIAVSYFGVAQVTWHNAATGVSGTCTARPGMERHDNLGRGREPLNGDHDRPVRQPGIRHHNAGLGQHPAYAGDRRSPTDGAVTGSSVSVADGKRRRFRHLPLQHQR